VENADIVMHVLAISLVDWLLGHAHEYFNPLDSKGNYSATSNNTKLVHWPLMGGVLHLVQRGGAGEAVARPVPFSLY